MRKMGGYHQRSKGICNVCGTGRRGTKELGGGASRRVSRRGYMEGRTICKVGGSNMRRWAEKRVRKGGEATVTGVVPLQRKYSICEELSRRSTQRIGRSLQREGRERGWKIRNGNGFFHRGRESTRSTGMRRGSSSEWKEESPV